jgi:type II secretory pathway pseudopilin PulG
VVVAIIAMLIGILVPALAGARRQGRSVVCMTNLREFGNAMQLYQQSEDSYLPSEGVSDGDSAGKPVGPWDDKSLWFNALPPMISSSFASYCEMQEMHMSGGARLPASHDKSLFVCPEAGPAAAGSNNTEVDSEGYFMMWGIRPGGTSIASPKERRPVYWSYIYNSGLDNALDTRGMVDEFGTKHIKIDTFGRTSEIPLLVEKLMTPDECEPRFTSTLNRSKTKGNYWNSCRLGSRHRQGGHLAFLDTHVGFISRADATTDVAGDGSFNHPGVLWQPD